MCQLVQAKSISSHLELASLAAAQVREGKTVLAEVIANWGSKAVDEAIQLANISTGIFPNASKTQTLNSSKDSLTMFLDFAS